MDGHANTAAPKVVNGINLDDLFALIEGVNEDLLRQGSAARLGTHRADRKLRLEHC